MSADRGVRLVVQWPVVLVLVLVGACVSGNGGSADDDTQAASFPVTHSAPTDGDPAVVALLDATGQPFCTGALISDREVLTAAHCFAAPAPPLASVFAGSVPGADGVRLEVASWRIDPDFDAASWRRDLAIIELAAAAPAPLQRLAVHAAPLAAARVGTPVRLVGFGASSAGEPIRKRTGQGRVGALSPDFVRTHPDPSQPCHGDSGGPVLQEIDGVEQIVGVVSHGDWLCAAHADAARVDPEAAPFLYETAPGAGGCAVAHPAARR